MRIIGGVLFLMGSIGMGIYQTIEYENGIEIRRQAVEMLRYLIDQIQVENASLTESICKVSVRLTGVFGEVLQQIQKRNNLNDGYPLSKIWESEMTRVGTCLTKEETNQLSHLLDQTGFYDAQTQLRKLKMALEELTGKIKEMEKQKETKCRLYQSIGVMGGGFVIILLW